MTERIGFLCAALALSTGCFGDDGGGGNEDTTMTSFGPSTGEGEEGDGDGDGDTSTGTTTTSGDGDGDGDGDTDTGTTGPGPNCGNGEVDPGEQCDDGNDDTTDQCAECKLAFCGDGFTQAGVEECDDANDDATDDCLPVFCTMATCGDGEIWAGNEECDDGNEIDEDACPTTCTDAECGDGFTWEGQEECDDANMVEDDICANDCTSNGIFYYADVNNQNDVQTACNDWNTFLSDIDNPNVTYNRVAIWGSQDQTGRECVGNEADQICKALANGGNANVNCDGNTWSVGNCGGVAVSASGNMCTCTQNAYTLRPCIGNFTTWGAVDSNECGPPPQIIEFVCQ